MAMPARLITEQAHVDLEYFGFLSEKLKTVSAQTLRKGLNPPRSILRNITCFLG
jgi:hypothetical protein